MYQSEIQGNEIVLEQNETIDAIVCELQGGMNNE